MVIAKLNNLRIAPRKVRLVINLVRGLEIKEAENQLKNLKQKAAGPIYKLLVSAVANAEHNFKFKKDNLYIKEIKADEGDRLKRWMPKAMGRATPIHKDNTHLTIVLDEKVKTLAGNKVGQEKNKKDKDTDVKVVKSLKEVKQDKNSVAVEENINKHASDEHAPEKKDIKDLSLKNFGSKKGLAKSDKQTNKVKKLFQRKTV